MRIMSLLGSAANGCRESFSMDEIAAPAGTASVRNLTIAQVITQNGNLFSPFCYFIGPEPAYRCQAQAYWKRLSSNLVMKCPQ
jgi:hypothetical protein